MTRPTTTGFGAILAAIPKRTPEEVEAHEEASRAAELGLDLKRVAHRIRRHHAAAAKLADVARLDEGDDAVLCGEGLQDTRALRSVRFLLAAKLPSPAERPARVLVLCGINGTGKSLAAAWGALHTACPLDGSRPASARVRQISDLSRLYASRWSASVEAYDLALASKYLVIDEVGTELDRDAARVALCLFDVINTRQRGGKMTVILSNKSERDFRHLYLKKNMRLDSRLHRVGRIVDCDGEDMRRR